jgi:chlorite dismutase
MTEPIPLGYTLFAVLAGPRPRVAPDAAAVAELSAAVDAVTAGGVSVRGLYDVTGMRGEADLMIWLHTTPGAVDDPAVLQKALRALRRTGVLQAYTPSGPRWACTARRSSTSVTCPATCAASARGWLCLYPFVRSYEWYLLPEEERAGMLAEHGRKGARFTEVVANTVSTFGLSDYEWLLPLESDDPSTSST